MANSPAQVPQHHMLTGDARNVQMSIYTRNRSHHTREPITEGWKHGYSFAIAGTPWKLESRKKRHLFFADFSRSQLWAMYRNSEQGKV